MRTRGAMGGCLVSWRAAPECPGATGLEPLKRPWRARPSGAKAKSSQGGQRFDIARLDRRAAPDTKARRRIPVGTDVIGDLFLFEQIRDRFRKGGLGARRKRRDRRIDHFEADAGVRPDLWVRARKSTQGVRSTQSASAFALASARAMSASRPPSDFAHFSASI